MREDLNQLIEGKTTVNQLLENKLRVHDYYLNSIQVTSQSNNFQLAKHSLVSTGIYVSEHYNDTIIFCLVDVYQNKRYPQKVVILKGHLRKSKVVEEKIERGYYTGNSTVKEFEELDSEVYSQYSDDSLVRRSVVQRLLDKDILPSKPSAITVDYHSSSVSHIVIRDLVKGTVKTYEITNTLKNTLSFADGVYSAKESLSSMKAFIKKHDLKEV